MYPSPQPYRMVMVAGGYSRNASRTTASANGNCTGASGWARGTSVQEQHAQETDKAQRCEGITDGAEGQSENTAKLNCLLLAAVNYCCCLSLSHR
jgi:hypothetical protein